MIGYEGLLLLCLLAYKISDNFVVIRYDLFIGYEGMNHTKRRISGLWAAIFLLRLYRVPIFPYKYIKNKRLKGRGP